MPNRNSGRGRGGRGNARSAVVSNPYMGWDLYFPKDPYTPEFSELPRINAYLKVFDHLCDEDVNEVKQELLNITSWNVEVEFLKTFVEELIPSVMEDIHINPTLELACIGLAIYHQTHKHRQEANDGSRRPQKITPRIVGFEPIVAIKNLKASYISKLVSIQGTVARVGNVKPFATQLSFICPRCNSEQLVRVSEGKYSQPTSCSSGECKSKIFKLQTTSEETKTIDWQKIKLQEILQDDDRDSGRIPRTIEVDLTGDLVDACVPGDIVTVTGIVKATTSDGGGRARGVKTMFLISIEANYVHNKNSSSDASAGNDDAEFTQADLDCISSIQAKPNLFKYIVNSLCPSIYGHELVKAGLCLGMFGGSKVQNSNKGNLSLRPDPHIIVVGDPGLGKSQLLHAVANVAPRGVYVCGNTTTSSGLTVTLVKEQGSGDYALEAGALVLADRGVCCIDEFDKMGSEHQSLLEAMEQQSISIAKAGICCSLPARTSIIAAANPVGGHYDKSKTISENLRMAPALLSRFDLVFILLDRPDEEKDRLLSEHIMTLHSLTGQKSSNGFGSAAYCHSNTQLEQQTLSQRLKLTSATEIHPIPSLLLRKYISYARAYVNPVLSPEAINVLQNFYMKLRESHMSADSTPITTRQLESLIRIAESRARIELRDFVTEQDAVDVVEIMKCSLYDSFSDECGNIDFTRSQNGSGTSKKKKNKQFISLLGRVAAQACSSLFSVDQMKRIASEAGMNTNGFEEFIASLNDQGYLLKKGARVYKLQTSEF
eukprot:Nk52_evm39s222 gene=Nk52_evmTU39s222